MPRSSLVALFAVPLLAACGGTEAAEQSAVDALSDLPNVTKVVEVTEDNDPNDLIGRPNGYEDATVFYDSRVECDSLGVSCGATLEVWPDAESAETRADYIEGLQAESPIFGTEYRYRDGALLLRVSGDLKPSAAAEYEQAFND